jgi:hypothetical protein
MTAPVEEIERVLAAADRAARDPSVEDATILEVHLEGPFISRGKLGAIVALTRGVVGLETENVAPISGVAAPLRASADGRRRQASCAEA